MELHKKIAIASSVALVFSIVFGFYGFLQFLKFAVRDQTALRNRNEVKQIYLKIPFPLNFKVYFFNVTNANEVTNGATPLLNEIGPYWYDLHKSKLDVIENEMEDSLQYSGFDLYEFNEAKSAPLSKSDYVTILHPLLVGMVNFVKSDMPSFLKYINAPIIDILENPTSIYMTEKVQDILFDGLRINCNGKGMVPVVCASMKKTVPGLKEKADEKNLFLFSVFGPRNGTFQKPIKILRGIKKSRDLGRLVEFDGQKMLDKWNSKDCNRFKGTDGWIFPPLMEKEEGLWTFSTDLCRNVMAYYIGPSTYKNIAVNEFHANLGDQSSNPEDKCYCPKPNKCLQKGLFDLTKCMGVPIYASLPHFYEADEELLLQVRGLKPNKDNHSIQIKFEQFSGTPLEATKRMQLNLPVSAEPKIPIMKNIPTALHPILWLEEGVALTDEFVGKIKPIFIARSVMDVAKYIFVLLSLGGLGFAGYLAHKKRQNTVQISPVYSMKANTEPNNKENDSDGDSMGKPSANTINAIRQKLNNAKNLEFQEKGYDNPALIKDEKF